MSVFENLIVKEFPYSILVQGITGTLTFWSKRRMHESNFHNKQVCCTKFHSKRLLTAREKMKGLHGKKAELIPEMKAMELSFL